MLILVIPTDGYVHDYVHDFTHFDSHAGVDDGPRHLDGWSRV